MKLAAQTPARVAAVLDGVLHVGHLRLELVAVELGRVRQRRREVAAPLPRRHRRRLDLVGVRDDAGVAFARRDHLRARQRGHVYDELGRRRAHLAARHGRRVSDAVGEDEAPFRIRIVDLAREAGEALDDVVVAQRLRPDCVLGEAEQQVHRRVARPDRARRLEGAEQRGGAAAVGLHPWHPVLGLQREAAGVVHDALADEADRLLGAFRRVREDHERRTLRRRLAHAPQPAVAAVAQRLAGDDIHLHRHARADEALGRGARSASKAMVPISSGGVSTMRAARRTAAAAFAAGPYAAADASSGPPSAVAKETRTVFSAAASSDGFFWSKTGKARAMAHAAGAACDADSSTEMMAAPPGLPAPLRSRRSELETACPRTGELCREQCSGSTPATTVLHVPSLLTMVVDAVAPSSPGFASSTSARRGIWHTGSRDALTAREQVGVR